MILDIIICAYYILYYIIYYIICTYLQRFSDRYGEQNETAEKLKQRKTKLLEMKEHRFFSAAQRLEIILSGFHDIFAAVIYIHQSCYIKFAINPIQPQRQ